MSSLLNHNGTSNAAYFEGRWGVRIRVMTKFGLGRDQYSWSGGMKQSIVQIYLLAQFRHDVTGPAEEF